MSFYLLFRQSSTTRGDLSRQMCSQRIKETVNHHCLPGYFHLIQRQQLQQQRPADIRMQPEQPTNTGYMEISFRFLNTFNSLRLYSLKNKLKIYCSSIHFTSLNSYWFSLLLQSSSHFAVKLIWPLGWGNSMHSRSYQC